MIIVCINYANPVLGTFESVGLTRTGASRVGGWGGGPCPKTNEQKKERKKETKFKKGMVGGARGNDVQRQQKRHRQRTVAYLQYAAFGVG